MYCRRRTQCEAELPELFPNAEAKVQKTTSFGIRTTTQQSPQQNVLSCYRSSLIQEQRKLMETNFKNKICVHMRSRMKRWLLHRLLNLDGVGERTSVIQLQAIEGEMVAILASNIPAPTRSKSHRTRITSGDCQQHASSCPRMAHSSIRC